MTSAIDGTYSSATGQTSSTTSTDDMDKDAFLLLLVTQFQYQDPLNPMEDKEFIAQLAQFTALEQQMSTNELMQQQLDMSELDQRISLAGYIGREVSARGYGVSVQTQEDDSKKISTLQYSLNDTMSKGSISIYNANNDLVASRELENMAAGVHDFDWDGKLANGETAPDGVYTVYVAGTDVNGNALLIDTNVTGTVQGVTEYNGEQILTLDDGRMVSLLNVREVMAPQTVTSTTSTEDADEDEDEDSLLDDIIDGLTGGDDTTDDETTAEDVETIVTEVQDSVNP